jgi:hypothetical protein
LILSRLRSPVVRLSNHVATASIRINTHLSRSGACL